MSPKTLTLIIAAVAIAADAGTTIAGLLPPAWGLVVGALVAGLVAVDRALHNVAQGVSLKSYLTSPSAWAAALVIVASIISAIAGVVPVTYATGIAVFAGMVLRLARVLQSALQPAGGQMLAATPGGLGTGAIPSTAQQQSGKVVSLPGTPTPPRGSPGPRPSSAGPLGAERPGSRYGDKGAVDLEMKVILVILAAFAVFCWAGIAKADAPTSPQLGGCVSNGAVCFGTAADVVLTKVGLSGDNKGISGGFSTGVGYGATLAPDKFYATGLDLFLNVNLSGSSAVASRLSPAIMLHTMNYLFIGVAMDITAPTDTSGSYGTGWSLLLGFGSTITSITPGYAKAEARRQLAAERANAESK